MKQLLTTVRRHPLALGLALIFALTWPIDLAFAAQSRGLIDVPILAALSLFVGYGFVVAAVLATAIVGGWAAVRALLGRFLIWRVRDRVVRCGAARAASVGAAGDRVVGAAGRAGARLRAAAGAPTAAAGHQPVAAGAALDAVRLPHQRRGDRLARLCAATPA